MHARRSGSPRLPAALAALLLVVVACSGGDEPLFGVGDSSTTTAAPGGGSASGGPGGGPSPSAPGGGSAGTATGGGGSMATAGGAGSSPSTTAAPPVIGVGSLPLGQVAPALLRPGRGDRIVLEVRAQAEAAPRQATIDHLVRVLRDVSGKQVVVDGVDGLGGPGRDWTQRSIIDAAKSAAQVESGRQQVVLRLLYLNGTYEGNDSVLGVAVAGDVAAVFSERIDEVAGLLVPPSTLEDAVSMHEIGHLLALVNLVLDTDRDDPDHPHHSRNRRSVMYWKVESDLILQLLDGEGIPRDFDADDLAELAEIRDG